MTDRLLDESLKVTASANHVHITWLVETQKWTQMNMDLTAANQFLKKLQQAIEAAKFLAELEDK